MGTKKISYIGASVLIGVGLIILVSQTKSENITTIAIPSDDTTQEVFIDSSISDKTESAVVTMDSGSFYFAPNVLKAKVGKEVNIDITSSGLHTFTIDELGVDVPTQDGVTTRVSFTPETAGIYTYYCAIPSHAEAGQTGTLIVTK